MKPESARTLAWTAGILIVLALVIISPSGAFALLVLAAVCAAIPSVFASRRPRAISAVLLIASIALAVNFYPAFKRDQSAYTQRVKERAAQTESITPTDQGDSKE
jgi:membrane protein implicated in regulation of membrane protease activity